MRPVRTVALSCLALAFATASAQQVVYDNTVNELGHNFPLLPVDRINSAEAGDEIWLAGSAREVTQVKLVFNYRGNTPGTWDGQLRFRSMTPQNTPGAVFFDTGVVTDLAMVSGLNTYTFEVPQVLVPDRFVWTIQAYNKDGLDGEMGPSYFNPPVVGMSEDFFWLSDMGSEWTPYSWGADPVANFAAQFTAVPEPASLAVLTLGLLLTRRRRK